MFSGFLPVFSFIKSIVFRKMSEFLKNSVRMSPINSFPFLPFTQHNYFEVFEPIFDGMVFWRVVCVHA